MNITINGMPADITIEKEQTVGEVLLGLENWLKDSGHRLSGIDIDGKTVHAGSFNGIFSRELGGIGSIDIRTSSWAELMAEALLALRRDIDEYAGLDFGAQRNFAGDWAESPESLFLAEQIPELREWALKTFSGEGAGAAELGKLVDERLRELEDPLGELGRAESIINETVRRLEDLPLDIQTGKDGRAAETVQIFSHIGEKMFRLFNLMKAEGYAVDRLEAGGLPLNGYIEEFGATLKELLAAYESRDAVLVGDLAEYELAPRLQNLYTAISAPAVS
ncbi:MAG: hypothetical protein LBQ55_10300 [Treponema sp.]|jgi:hypothetical protein|nr:hypothetical protein [Treponema sp.]